MSWVYLPKGVYLGTTHLAACTNCGKNAAPQGCLVSTEEGDGVTVRSVICDSCVISTIRASKRKKKRSAR